MLDNFMPLFLRDVAVLAAIFTGSIHGFVLSHCSHNTLSRYAATYVPLAMIFWCLQFFQMFGSLPTFITVAIFYTLGIKLGDGFVAIGLTGGIGTGKSSVSNLFKSKGVPVIDADVIARQVVERGKPAYKEIVRAFGDDILDNDGSIHRERLGKIIFNDPSKRSVLNFCTHKYIIVEMFSQLLYHKLIRNEKLVIFDAPLLFETRILEFFCHPIIVVSCSEEQQTRRLMDRDQASVDEVLPKIQSQMKISEKCRRADIVIDNNGTKEELAGIVNDVYVEVGFRVGAYREVLNCAVVNKAKIA